MKKYRHTFSMLLATTGALLAVPSVWGQATNITVNTFNSAAEVTNNWTKWWGDAPTTMQFDPTMDANGNTNSGSMKVTVQFNLATYTNNNQFALRGALAGNGQLGGLVIDASQYTNLVFDLFWATNSPRRPWGDLGGLDVGLVPTDYSQDWFPDFGVPVTNGWQHIVLPINPTAANIGKIGGVVLKMWSGDSTWGQTGTATFWVDNVKLIAKVGPPPPPPSMSIQKTIPGLNLLASQTSGNNPQYQRQNIRTLPTATTLTDFTWIDPNEGLDGNPARPITYAVTITNYPGTNYAEFQTHIFVAPGSPTESEPDWNEANIIFLDIHNHANGSASATFRYKTNEPSGNIMLFNNQPGGQFGTNGWGQGVLGTVNSSNILGTWSLTFSGVTNVTITSSSGATNTFSITSDVASLFYPAVTVYVGAQPNSVPAIGQTVVLSRFQIIGAVTPLDDDFTSAALDATKWAVAADDAPGVAQVPTNAPYWVSMTLPAVGFNLQIGTNLADTNSWTRPTLASSGAVFGKQRFLVSSSVLPGPGTNTVFIRAVKTQ